MSDFQIQFRVRYAETDAMGVVHHAVYPVWFEMGRTEFLRHAGMSYRAMEDLGLQSPVIELRLSIAYGVSANGELLCTGESEHAFLYAGHLAALQKTCPEIHELLARCAQPDDAASDEPVIDQPASALS